MDICVLSPVWYSGKSPGRDPFIDSLAGASICSSLPSARFLIHQLNKRLSSSQAAAAVTEHAHFTRWLACALLRPPLYLPRSLSLSVCLSECVYVRARASASLSRERRKMLLSRERDGREKERDWAEERMS